jgi:hypothetical protein
MTLEDSPSLENYTADFSEEQPDFEPAKPKKSLRVLLFIFLGLFFILAVINFTQSDRAAVVFGKGDVYGQVVDNEGNPIPAEIFVFGTNIQVIADSNGNFVIDNLPDGSQSLIVAHGDIATEVFIEITAGGAVDIGVITVPTDIEPG